MRKIDTAANISVLLIFGAVVYGIVVHYAPQIETPGSVFAMINQWVAILTYTFLFFIFIGWVVRRQQMRTLNILQKKCDPYTYASRLLKAKGRYYNRRNKNINHQVAMEINLAAAYDWQGVFDRAIDMLNDIDIDGKPYLPGIRAIYYNNLFSCLIDAGRLDEAKSLFENKKYFMVAPMSRNNTDSAASPFITYDYYFGNKEKAIGLLEDLYKRTIPLCNRLSILFLLAEDDIEQRRTDRARERLQEIIDKGNRLFLVDKAKELLETTST